MNIFLSLNINKMDNKVEENETLKITEDNIEENNKILIENKSEKNIMKNILKIENDSQKQTNEESEQINRLEKSQILQNKLKKIFIDRETNKFKYNIVNIPDNLKYSSDNSNSSSPREKEEESKLKINKDVKNQNKASENNNKNIKEINVNEEFQDINSKNNIDKEKTINIEEEQKIEEDNNKKNNTQITSLCNNMINNGINYNINKNIENNNNNIVYCNGLSKNDNFNIEDKNNAENSINTNNNLNNNRNKNKNYVIKRIPERKKNRNKNIKNEDDFRNRTFSMGFINHKKKSNSNSKNSEQHISGKIIEKEEKEISDINSNNNEKGENEEERNKRLYRLLMAKKLGNSQNTIRNNINQVINSKNLEINKEEESEKNIEISDQKITTKSLPLQPPKEEKTEINMEKKEINNNLNQKETLSKINKDSNKAIKVNPSKGINAKEGALKILELIKAKKSEKNFIDQKKIETQNIIKKANGKSVSVDITESNSTLLAKKEEINENKNDFNFITNKQMQIKENEAICIKEKKSEKDENEKNEKNVKKDLSKKIYKKFKGKFSLTGNNNKNEFDNVANNKKAENNISKEKENENINTKDFIKDEFKKDIKENDKINNIKNINNFDNGYKKEIEKNNIVNAKISNNKIKNKKNNIIFNSEEKIKREKLEKDLAVEINKDKLTDREKMVKSKNISKKKFIRINHHYTSINIANKQNNIFNNKKPLIQIKEPNYKNVKIKYNISQPKIDNSNNVKELNLFKNQNDIATYITTNMNDNLQNISHNFYADTKIKKYEQMKTYQNPKKSIDNYTKKNNNISIKNQNKMNNINNIYEPKKCILSKGKTKTRDLTKSPFSPGIYTNNPSNKKDKPPKDFNLNNEKMTYIKKNLSNISSNKKDNNHRLNNSLGNIPSSFNNNFDLNKIIKNKMSTEIDSLELKHNLNSSFHMGMNLGKNKYNTGNIFNQENDDNDYEDKFLNKNYNINSSYNNKFFQKNLSKSYKDNNLDNGYNTFYINNKNIIGNNYLNKNEYMSNTCKRKIKDINYGKVNKNNINTIYNNKNENKNIWKNDYDNNNIYNSANIFNQNNFNKSDYKMNFYDTIKYEDLLILEDKLINIMISLNNEKLIFNECFDYWNYFFNCFLYENIDKFLYTFDVEKKNLIKISLNYNLMSILLSYDTSFEFEKLDKIRPLLLEMLELCHKLLIASYEFILGTTKNNNNLWVKKLYHLINSSKLSDGSDTLFLESSKISEKEKLKYNTNYLIQKIHYILYNYPSSFSQSYLMSLFKKINNKSFDDINDFFLEYILREKDNKYSILASSFLKSGEIITPQPYPYLNYTSPKNYTLILDVDETLFHFKINEDDDEQGVLKIRPGVFQFINEIKEYYEIILFSEADKNYIDLIIDAVGDNKYLYDYILCRDYVTIVGQNFVKELSKIGRPLDRIIIIDNMPQNFSFNKENGIYIKSFWGEENDDKAFIDLIPILVNIARSGKDVRKELVKYKEKIVTKISSNIYMHNNI